MTTLEQFKNAGEQVTMSNVQTREYRLMYYFGVWMTSERIYAESDAEAIYDADHAEKKAIDKLVYALWCGKRMVKRYTDYHNNH